MHISNSSLQQCCKRQNIRAVHIFAHFTQGLRKLDGRKFDVSENYIDKRTNPINVQVFTRKFDHAKMLPRA